MPACHSKQSECTTCCLPALPDQGFLFCKPLPLFPKHCQQCRSLGAFGANCTRDLWMQGKLRWKCFWSCTSGERDKIFEVWWGGKGCAQKRVWCTVSQLRCSCIPESSLGGETNGDERLPVLASLCSIFHIDTSAARKKLTLLRTCFAFRSSNSWYALSAALTARYWYSAAQLFRRVGFLVCCWGSSVAATCSYSLLLF